MGSIFVRRFPSDTPVAIPSSGGGSSGVGFYDTFSATAGQTIFTLSQSTVSPLLFVNGILSGPEEYSISGTTLTFVSGLNAGDIVDVYSTIGSGGITNGTLYFSADPQVDGNWRIALTGNNLSIQRMEGGLWIEKSVVLP